MRALGIVPFNPLSNNSTGLGEAGEIVLPDAFLIEVGPAGRSVPKRARQASSSARSVFLVRPHRANSKPVTSLSRPDQCDL
jgi:hypothetical protein